MKIQQSGNESKPFPAPQVLQLREKKLGTLIKVFIELHYHSIVQNWYTAKWLKGRMEYVRMVIQNLCSTPTEKEPYFRYFALSFDWETTDSVTKSVTKFVSKSSKKVTKLLEKVTRSTEHLIKKLTKLISIIDFIREGEKTDRKFWVFLDWTIKRRILPQI